MPQGIKRNPINKPIKKLPWKNLNFIEIYHSLTQKASAFFSKNIATDIGLNFHLLPSPLNLKTNKMTNQQAFEKLISLYDICDYLQDINEEENAEDMRNTLNELSAFIQSLNNQ